MQPTKHDSDFEKQVKAALAPGFPFGEESSPVPPGMRDRLMFEAGKTHQKRNSRNQAFATLLFGLAGGLALAFLPPLKVAKTPVEPATGPILVFTEPLVPKTDRPSPGTATVWNWHMDHGRIDEPTHVPAGSEFITTIQPMNVRSFSPILKELQQ